MNTPIEDEVRTLLHEHADAVEHTSDPWARTRRAIDADHRHRRRLAGGIAGVVLAIGMGTGAALSSGSLRPDRATVPAHKPWSGPAATGSVTSWPPRGSLVADDAFMAQARDRLHRSRAMGTHIVYAGDVKQQRVVLAVGPSPSPRSSASLGHRLWSLAGPVGAPVSQLTWAPWGPGDELLKSRDVLAWTRKGVGHHRQPVLVLARSAVSRGQVSTERHYGSDGTVPRVWRSIHLTNGVWTGRTGPQGQDTVRLQVGRELLPFSYDTPTTIVPAGPAGSLIAEFKTRTLSRAHIDATVLFHDSIGGPITHLPVNAGSSTSPRTGRASLTYALLRLSDGSTFRSAQVDVARPDGSVVRWRPLEGAPVSAKDAQDYPLVFLDHSGPDEQTIYVVAPSGQSAVLHGPDRRRLKVNLSTEGVGYTATPASELPHWPTQWTVQTRTNGSTHQWKIHPPTGPMGFQPD